MLAMPHIKQILGYGHVVFAISGVHKALFGTHTNISQAHQGSCLATTTIYTSFRSSFAMRHVP